MEWRPVSRMPGYEINRRGDVRSLKTGRLLTRTPHPTSGDRLPRVTFAKGQAQVNVLLEETWGPGAAVAAGFPAPNMARVATSQAFAGRRRECDASRRCHSCGRPTNNYRCELCWRRIRGYGANEIPDSLAVCEEVS